MEQKTFNIQISQTLSKVVTVQASNLQEAIDTIKKDINKGKHTLASINVTDDKSFRTSVHIGETSSHLTAIGTYYEYFYESADRPLVHHDEIVDYLEQRFLKSFKNFDYACEQRKSESYKSNDLFRKDVDHQISAYASENCLIYEILAKINNTSFDGEAERLHRKYNLFKLE